MTVHFDNPRWQDAGSRGTFGGKPVLVRNGMPEPRHYVYRAPRHWWVVRNIRQAMEEHRERA